MAIWACIYCTTIIICVLPFHSVCCLLNEYHLVKEEKWNINDLKNINYSKVNDLFFISVSKVCARLICSGDNCPGVSVLGGICPGVKGPGGYMSGGICLGVSVRGVHVRGGYVKLVYQQRVPYNGKQTKGAYGKPCLITYYYLT